MRACIPSSEWSDVLEDGDSSYAAFSPVASGSTKRDSPPTSPEVEGEAKSGLVCSEAVETEDVEEVAAEAPLSSSGPTRKLQARTVSASTSNNNKQGAKADLLSFFRAVSPKKRARVHSDDEADLSRPRKDPLRRLGRKDASTPSTARDRLSSTSTSSSSSHPAKGKPVKPPKLEQLFLDPFETGGHATLSCAVCSLAYARTPEDLALHAKHHKNVVGGCDWVTGDAKGVLVIEEGIEWGAHDGGRIVMVDASAEGVLGRKVARRPYLCVENAETKISCLLPSQIKDVLATIDTELSSTSLTPAQLGACKLFLFVSPQRKVIACAVVERIEESYRVVSSKAPPSSPTNDEKKPTGELIRFGEQDGAVFCSYVPFASPFFHRTPCSVSLRSISQAHPPANTSRRAPHLVLRLTPSCRPGRTPPIRRGSALHLRVPDPAPSPCA